MHFGTLDVRRDGVREESELAHVRSSGNIQPLSVVVDRRIGRSKRRRKAAVECGVQELGRLRKENLAEMVERQTGLLHRVCDSHRLEVSTVVDVAGLAINKRVIGGGVALLGHDRPGMEDIFELGSDELGRSAERVPILPELALVFLDGDFLFFTALGQLATLEQVPNLLGRLDLARVRARHSVDERMVRGCKLNFSTPY